MIWVALISILILTALVWLLKKFLPFRACAVCAGVSLTWLWLLGAYWLGYSIDTKIIALLIGGSVVGVAYELKKKMAPTRFLLWWKLVLIIAGFAAAYGLIEAWWSLFFAGLIPMLLLAILAFKKRGPQPFSEKVEELKKQMEECC